eukprot:jgi/Picsp_1/2892/NSC_01117-R1_protein
MSYSGGDLLLLQQQIKRDPQGYKDEFQMQWRHYLANRSLFLMSPGQCSLEFQSLTMFLAHVSENFPEEVGNSFVTGIIEMLDKHGPLLEHGTRMTLVKSLILMRNKSQVPATVLLPVLFRLFPLKDKTLRQLMSRHIAADIRGANKKSKNEQFNRKIQNILLPIVEEDDEICAKRALVVLTDMWRRQVWRDAKTANAIAAAAFHPSYRVMLASLKFFLGQDVQDEGPVDSDDDDDDDGQSNGARAAPQPSKEDVYKAFHKGTQSSKKKKQKKLRRAMASVKKTMRREEGHQKETFAAIQLLHDPQGFAEKLFARMRNGNEKAETRMLMMSVISRVIGVHEILLLNFYPYLQKYINPSRPEITTVLAALIQSCHEQVPPDVMAPVLRQLVDRFVHDKARPEIITVGIKTVRELCLRAPLVMTPELLQELVEYKKFRDKEVSTTARGLLGLFREIAPSMLRKKDRGRNADMSALPTEYGATTIADRVQGAELLEQAVRAGKIDPETGEIAMSSSDDEDEEEEADDSSDESEEEAVSADQVSDESFDEGDVNEEEPEASVESEPSSEHSDQLNDSASQHSEDESPERIDSLQIEKDGKEDEVPDDPSQETRPSKSPQADSIKSLKRKLQAEKKKNDDTQEDTDATIPLEWGRILTQEDFRNIKALRHKQIVDEAMKKHGLKSARRREAAREAAEIEADTYIELQDKRAKLHEQAVNPSDLLGKRRGKQTKEERLATVMEGREGREFGAKSRVKKAKTGGLSNKEKLKRKKLPMRAVSGQVRKRLVKNKMKSAKNFKGHVRK